MDFRTWFENEELVAQQMAAPASAEVIRSGLQPQVDAEEIETAQKKEFEKLQAIGGNLQQIQKTAAEIDPNSSPRLAELKKFCDQLIKGWRQVKK